MAPFSHEKVAEPSNLQSLRGAVMIQFQERYLINPLGLERAWGVHPYRALVATHVTKTAKNHPNRTAAALLLNLEKTVRDTYGKFRPEDAYNDAYNGLAALEDTGEDD